MLLPDKPSAKKGEPVTFVYQFGHPFEHQLSDAPAPKEVFVLGPDGKKTDLTKTLEAFKTAGEKPVTAYRFRLTPQERGDYIVALRTPMTWAREEKEFMNDQVQVVLHVEEQKGWFADLQERHWIVPLTRPYGLAPGGVFQVQLKCFHSNTSGGDKDDRDNHKGLAWADAEIERYNPSPPPVLPPDEQMTRRVRADQNGVVTCSLTESGWWGVSFVDRWKKKENGKEQPVTTRVTHWVFVDGKDSPSPQAKSSEGNPGEAKTEGALQVIGMALAAFALVLGLWNLVQLYKLKGTG